jgi:hypothetical protein
MLRTPALVLAAITFIGTLCFGQTPPSGTSLSIQGYYEPPNHVAYGTSGFAPVAFGLAEASGPGERDLGSTWGAAGIKGIVTQRLVIPVLRGEGDFFKDNYLSLEGSGELSPVSINASFEATLVPIAFLKISVGAEAGTGWDMGFIGLGVNPADDTQDIEKKSFQGVVWRTWATGTFQFDLAALLPGKWNHVVAVVAPTVEYKAFTGADDDTAWLWEADDGMNFNGFKLKGSYFIGYRMPLALDTVGLLMETEEWLASVRNRSPQDSAGGWGSDFTFLDFGPVLNFALGDKSSIAILLLFKNGIKWTDATTKRRYFENREFEESYLYFGRLAVSYSLQL